MGAAIDDGNPKNRNNSGKTTKMTAPTIEPLILPIPPKITMSKIVMDSITVKLEGSMKVL